MTKHAATPERADETVGAVASALSSAPRRAIVNRLCRGPATTSELAAETGTALPTMHQHLERLRSVGLISSTKHGRTVTHTADLAPLADLQDWITTRRAFWNAQLGLLAHSLESRHDQ